MKQFAILILAFLVAVNVSAKEKKTNTEKNRNYKYTYETDAIKLTKLIEYAQPNIDKPILVNAYTRSNVVAAGAPLDKIDLDTLGQILANNFMTIVKTDKHLLIVPFKMVRSMQTPIIESTSNANYKDWQWVTTTIKFKKIRAANILPVLRPLVPQPGHLAAYDPSNTIVMTASYGVVKRIAKLIEEVEKKAE